MLVAKNVMFDEKMKINEKRPGMVNLENTRGQSYKHFTIVNYNSRVVNYDCKVL